MAKKTNCTINGKEYYRIYRKVGKKLNKAGLWVDEYKNFYGSCKSEAEAAYNDYMSKRRSGSLNKCLGQVIDEWAEAVFFSTASFSACSSPAFNLILSASIPCSFS